MHRPLVLGLAVLVVFVGLTTVLPILESDIDASPQAAAVAYMRATPVGEPSCIISAHPQVAERGEEVSLAWSSENVEDLFLMGDLGEVSANGGAFVTPEQSQVYTLYVRSISGEVSSCSTSVTVL